MSDTLEFRHEALKKIAEHMYAEILASGKFETLPLLLDVFETLRQYESVTPYPTITSNTVTVNPFQPGTTYMLTEQQLRQAAISVDITEYDRRPGFGG